MASSYMSDFKFIIFSDAEKYDFRGIESNEIERALQKIKLPIELLDFYRQIGYGFVNLSEPNAIYRILDPIEVVAINRREGIYSSDPELESFEDEFYKNKVIFFEVNEGIYLTMNVADHNKKNSVYYFRKKIADSFEEFLKKFDENPFFFEE